MKDFRVLLNNYDVKGVLLVSYIIGDFEAKGSGF